jgi:hypothetical protein
MVDSPAMVDDQRVMISAIMGNELDESGDNPENVFSLG